MTALSTDMKDLGTPYRKVAMKKWNNGLFLRPRPASILNSTFSMSQWS